MKTKMISLRGEDSHRWLLQVELCYQNSEVQENELLQKSTSVGEEASTAEKATGANSLRRRITGVFTKDGAAKTGSEKGREEEVCLDTPESNLCLHVWVQ